MDKGRTVILNGAPRSGKSSIVRAIQDHGEGPWMNIGVDVHYECLLPARYRPGIGLRPGANRPDLESLVQKMFSALYLSIRAHSEAGLNVVADIGHHDGYTQPLGILPDCARILGGFPVLFVGVRCPIDIIMQRRNAGQEGREGVYAVETADDPVPLPVRLWQEKVHQPGIYDLEVDTSLNSPEICADIILERLRAGPEAEAFRRLAEFC